MDSTPVTRSKRKLTSTHGAKRQKTSTPSRSRIEHYMSPGDISKVVGSPNIDEITDGSIRGERSSLRQRLLGDGDKNRNNKIKASQISSKRGGKGDASLLKKASVKRIEKSTDDESIETTQVNQTTIVQRTASKKGQTISKSNKSAKKQANLSSTLQNATIDKFLSPDLNNSAISTPTRFPTNRSKYSSSDNDEAKSGSKKKKTTKQRNHQMSAGTSNISENEPSTSVEVHSEPDDRATHVRAKGSNQFLASGNIKTHMEDKEFLTSQAHTLSKPFTMDGGPRQWINTWKAHQSASQNDDGEMDEIPEKVIHKALSKLNYAMNSDLGSHLSRHQQRKVLINLDDIRKEERSSGNEERRKRKGMLKMGAALEEILEHYSSKWPITDEVEEDASDDEIEMADRYQEVYARLSVLNDSLTRKEQERQHLQNIYCQLQEINENLRSCTDSDFKEELDRTKSLVSQILKKLNQRRSPRKHSSSEPTAAPKVPSTKEGYKYQLAGHQAIVRHLLASSF